MKQLSKLVKDFLDYMGLRHEQINHGKDFKIGFRGDNGGFSALITVNDGDRIVNVCTLCPINVPKTKLLAVAELIARINCGLALGNLDIDLGDGLILFRTGIKVGHINLDHETLLVLICGNLWMMDRYFPAIASVAYGNSTPEEAVAALEDEKKKMKQTQRGPNMRPSRKRQDAADAVLPKKSRSASPQSH